VRARCFPLVAFFESNRSSNTPVGEVDSPFLESVIHCFMPAFGRYRLLFMVLRGQRLGFPVYLCAKTAVIHGRVGLVEASGLRQAALIRIYCPLDKEVHVIL